MSFRQEVGSEGVVGDVKDSVGRVGGIDVKGMGINCG